MLRKLLVIYGVLSSLLYVAINIFVPMMWDGYSSVSQTVSELSALGAQTRQLWRLRRPGSCSEAIDERRARRQVFNSRAHTLLEFESGRACAASGYEHVGIELIRS